MNIRNPGSQLQVKACNDAQAEAEPLLPANHTCFPVQLEQLPKLKPKLNSCLKSNDTHRHGRHHLGYPRWSKLVIIHLNLVDALLTGSGVQLVGQPVDFEVCIRLLLLDLLDRLLKPALAHVAPWAACTDTANMCNYV